MHTRPLSTREGGRSQTPCPCCRTRASLRHALPSQAARRQFTILPPPMMAVQAQCKYDPAARTKGPAFPSRLSLPLTSDRGAPHQAKDPHHNQPKLPTWLLRPAPAAARGRALQRCAPRPPWPPRQPAAAAAQLPAARLARQQPPCHRAGRLPTAPPRRPARRRAHAGAAPSAWPPPRLGGCTGPAAQCAPPMPSCHAPCRPAKTASQGRSRAAGRWARCRAARGRYKPGQCLARGGGRAGGQAGPCPSLSLPVRTWPAAPCAPPPAAPAACAPRGAAGRAGAARRLQA